MPIVRTYKRERFVVIEKTCLEDKELSLKAKGLHSYLMTLPDDWDVQMGHIENQSTEGRTAVRSAMAELIKAGYVKRSPCRTELGHLNGTLLTVFERKQGNLTERPVSRLSVNPSSGQRPPTEEPRRLNNHKELNNHDITSSALKDEEALEGKKANPGKASFPKASVKEILAIYEKVCGGTISWARAQKALNRIPLDSQASSVLGFQAYCDGNDPKFISVESFASKAGYWNRRAAPPPRATSTSQAAFEEMMNK